MENRIKYLEDIIKDHKGKIAEMQGHIDCLKAELVEVQDGKRAFPQTPIDAAKIPIEESSCVELGEHIVRCSPYFSKSDLRQIAEHLLSYCNNCTDRD